MAYLGIKTGYASALESLIAGIGKRGTSSTDIPGIGSGGRLKSLGITGQGAHLWDLGELVRPTVLGEWETIGKWVDLIGRRIVPHLTRAVGGCHVSHRGYKLKRVDSGTLIETSANPMTEAGEDIADAHAKQEYAYISSWAGILWTKNRFSLAGLDEAPTEKTLRSMDYRNAMSWDEIVRMTACQERIGHPVFALFV
ncbi:Hypothetical protein D9617_22g066410 [Elsinoe fawcettii]|nr:Hypothetical protein D9617_22g066410 [Elsinoe fawcettii]